MTVQTTLKEIRREALRIGPDIGQYFAISGLAAQTVTASRRATGSLSTGKGVGRYLLRPDAASQPADRERISTAFDSALGKWTHAGAAYGDTTVGTETLEVLNYDPFLIDQSIFTAIPKCRFRDVYELPSSLGSHWLGALSWVRQPSDILDIKFQSSNILSRNRYLNQWNTVSTGGVLTPPDGWVLAGAAATVLLSQTQTWKRQAWSTALTRAGTNCTLTQTVTVLDDGTATTSNTMRGQVVNSVFRVWCSVASRVRAFVYDGTTTTYSSYHTGGSTFEELVAVATLATTATNLTFGLSLETGDTTVYVGEGYLTLGTVSDSQREDYGYREEILFNRYGTQGATDLPVSLPRRGLGGRYLISTQRPYPSLDETRFLAGTADGDVTFAPVTLVASHAIWRMFRTLSKQGGQDTSKFEKTANEWAQIYSNLAMKHLYVEGMQDPTDRMLSQMLGRSFGYPAAGPQDAYAGAGGRSPSWARWYS